MKSKDKTGDQLLASIRKSKAGVVAQKTQARATARRTAARPAATAQKAKPKPDARPAGCYSHGRRVWPD